MSLLFNNNYYFENKQNKDRIGLLFYKNIINKYIKPEFVLDYGCGLGYFLKRIDSIRSVKKSYGFDISDYAINQAKKISPNSIIIKNLNEIKDNSLNLIIALHVIEHMKDNDLINIINKFNLILKKNGYILFATPAKNALAHELKKNNWIGFKDKTHINLKTLNEWKDFFKINNLLIEISSSDGLWNFPYKLRGNYLRFIKIFILMALQIFTGKLLLNCNEGETFIFLLKKKN